MDLAIIGNSLQTTLILPYVAGSGTVTLTGGYGAKLAAELAAHGQTISPTSPLRFTLVSSTALDSSSTIITGTLLAAIYKATGLSGDTLTGVTVQEGTVDQNFNANDVFMVTITAGQILDIQSELALRVKNIAPSLTGPVTIQAPLVPGDNLTIRDSAGNAVGAFNTTGANAGLTTQFGIGTGNPLRPLHIVNSSIGAGTNIAVESTDTTNNNGFVISGRTTTTGVGATTFQDYADIRFKIPTHDQPTLAGIIDILTRNGAGAFNTFTFDQLGNFVSPTGLHGPSYDKGGRVFNIKNLTYGAKCNGVSVAATAVNVGSTLTAAGLTTTDIGKTISIPGAGTAGAYHVTTISNVSGTTITLTNPIITGVGTATVFYGTDDKTAINAALTAASAVKGTVFIPAGVTMLATALTIPSNVNITGTGPGSIIQGCGNNTILFPMQNVSNIQISNLKINGGATSGIGIGQAASYIRVTNCEISNCTTPHATILTCGITITASDHVWIDSNRFVGNGYAAPNGSPANGTICFTPNTVLDSTDIIISNNIILNAGLYAISGFDVNRCKILNNTIDQGNVGNTDQNTGYGVLLYATGTFGNFMYDNVVSGNTVTNCYGYGIYLNQVQTSIVSKNIVRSVVLQQDTGTLRMGAIVLNGNTRTIVEGNNIDGVGGAQTNQMAGIAAVVDTESRIVNNIIANITATSGDGISIGGTGTPAVGTGTVVSGNTIISATRYGIQFDTGQNKISQIVDSNLIIGSGSVALLLGKITYSTISNNVIVDFGNGQQGVLALSTYATTQNLITNNTIKMTTTNTGQAFRIDCGPNQLINNIVQSLGTLGTAFMDASNTTPPNVYVNNMVFGTVTARFTFSGQVAAYAGNYSFGTAAPTTTPRIIGERFFDTTNKKIYEAVGTASSADWSLLN